VLRRLSLLAGPFTLDDAQAAAIEIGIDAAEFVEALAQLVNKSLIFADISKEATRYCFLDATRAYAQSKLAETR
jgi:predicted ATPase